MPKGCERCQIEEANNIASKRQLDYQRWQNHYDQYKLDSDQFITASIAFGNTCNLKCITCNPYNSSLWQKEYQQIYNKTIPVVRFYRADFVERFAEQAPEVIHLDIPGGEPFISGVPEQQKLLNHYVNTGQSKNITLHYTTNATIYPDTTWWNLWQEFKQVEIQLSIDGIGQHYEYIRYPANWNTLLDNVNKYKSDCLPNMQLSVSHTVSAYNIYYLDEFFTWCADIGLPKPWAGRVHNPTHMRPTVWPEPVRSQIINKLRSSTHKDVQTWATLIESADDSEHYVNFKKYQQLHDQARGVDFNKVFPELNIIFNDIVQDKQN